VRAIENGPARAPFLTMPPLAYFGIESNAFNVVVSLLIVFLVVLYLSLIYWTYADARRRVVDPMLVGCATAASLFPFVGTLIYLILRPPEYLEDVREREIETQAAEARLHQLDHGLCPHCDYPIEREFVRCPSCLRKLKERCASCSKPLNKAWTICPYCEAEVAEAPPRRRSRRRATAASDIATAASDIATAASDIETVPSDLMAGDSATRVGESAANDDLSARPVRGTLTAPEGEEPLIGRSRRPRSSS
jgi:Double zinc ribbon